MSKINAVLTTLKKNKWVPGPTIIEKTGDKSLRALRHLRSYGHIIETRNNKGVFEYRRVSG